ncbi:hypothetical protein BH20ACT7_BH20ACT7_16600 [soil metagenome]
MANTLRSCTRTGCGWPAAASLSYRYATRQAWLLELAPTPDVSLYDLCPHHADNLVVPNGWERVDDRTASPVVVEPSARDRAAEAAARRQAAAEGLADELASPSAGVSRYAQLAADLPRLAAQMYGKQTPGTPPATRPRPIPSRDLAPLPLPGQLTMPVDQTTEGVVVAIDAAGSRRRRDERG